MSETEQSLDDTDIKADADVLEILFRELSEEPYKFDFFQALRRLECLFADLPRIGESRHANEDPIRFCQDTSMAFAPATVSKFQPPVVDDFGSRKSPARLFQLFLGMLGPNGPMPVHVTEYTYERIHNHHDPTLARFLDIFHHRLISLFYRAWSQATPTTSFDRPSEDQFAIHLGALMGLGMKSLQHRDEMPDLAKLHYAGALAAQTRHPEGLRGILFGFFQVPISIREFEGHWLRIPRAWHWHISQTRKIGVLGVSSTIGERVWDVQTYFRIVMGPLSFANFLSFLPEGDSLPRFIAVVRNYAGDDIGWDMQLVLKRDEVPPLQLGVMGRLGWSTWVTSKPMTRDPDDFVAIPLLVSAE